MVVHKISSTVRKSSSLSLREQKLNAEVLCAEMEEPRRAPVWLGHGLGLPAPPVAVADDRFCLSVQSVGACDSAHDEWKKARVHQKNVR